VSTEDKTATKAVAKIDPRKYDQKVSSVNDLMVLGKPLLPQITAALPAMMARNAERFLRMLLTECQKSPRLMECTPRSLFGGVIQAAQLGLEIGGPLGESYLLPFKGEATFLVGYKGYKKMAFNTPQVADLSMEVVRAKDVFEILLGTEKRIFHKPDYGFDSEVTGYYSTCNLVSGGKAFKYMTRAQIEAHRDRYALYRDKNGVIRGPWIDSPHEMGCKTTFRYLSKIIPLSSELSTAATLDEMGEEGIPQQLGSNLILDGVEGVQEDKPKSLKDKLDKAKKADSKGSGPNGEYVPGVDDPDQDPALFGNQSEIPH
jgi:recombination protein RecT